MLAWTACIGCLVRACSRERAYPPNKDRLSMPLLEGPPLMDPLDVTHGVLRCWSLGRAWCGGTITLQALGLLVSLPFQACCQHA